MSMELSELQDEVVRFAADRDWGQFHDPKNLAMALASEAGELLALLRWVSNAQSDQAIRGTELGRSLMDEVGDVGILLLLLCRRADIDLASAVTEKLQRNAVRYPVGDSRGRAERPPETIALTPSPGSSLGDPRSTVEQARTVSPDIARAKPD
jgi:dCTP diphosphatase